MMTLFAMLVVITLIKEPLLISGGNSTESDRAVSSVNTTDKTPVSLSQAPSTTGRGTTSNNCTSSNGTALLCAENTTFENKDHHVPKADNDYGQNLMKLIEENKTLVIRSVIILSSISAIILIFFIIRAIRVRRLRGKARKYGVIATSQDSETQRLEAYDDDEDMTLYEAKGKTK